MLLGGKRPCLHKRGGGSGPQDSSQMSAQYPPRPQITQKQSDLGGPPPQKGTPRLPWLQKRQNQRPLLLRRGRSLPFPRDGPRPPEATGKTPGTAVHHRRVTLSDPQLPGPVLQVPTSDVVVSGKLRKIGKLQKIAENWEIVENCGKLGNRGKLRDLNPPFPPPEKGH